MFGKRKKDIQSLSRQVEQLSRQLKEMKEHYEEQIRVLRRQAASLASGLAPAPQSILLGLPYSEIPKERVEEFIQSVPDLLILDLRTDQGWNQGHIPEAKHIPAGQVLQRLDEIPDKSRPILTVCANGNTSVSVCQLLAREGYQKIYNALGGMAGYPGELVRPDIRASDLESVTGTDRQLIARVLEIIDREIRPGLKRDGGDLQVLAVEEGIVKVKMVGACLGCGAQKRTVEEGIQSYLMSKLPELRGVEDHSLGIAP